MQVNKNTKILLIISLILILVVGIFFTLKLVPTILPKKINTDSKNDVKQTTPAEKKSNIHQGVKPDMFRFTGFIKEINNDEQKITVITKYDEVMDIYVTDSTGIVKIDRDGGRNSESSQSIPIKSVDDVKKLIALSNDKDVKKALIFKDLKMGMGGDFFFKKDKDKNIGEYLFVSVELPLK